MTNPAPDPRLEVVVVGSSIGAWLRPPRRDAFEGNHGEVLARRLRDRGLDVGLTNSCGWWVMVDQVFREVEDRVLRYGPHVVVVNVGFLEAQPTWMPTGLTKWLFTWRASGARHVQLTRRVLRPLIDGFYRHVHPRLLRLLPFAPSRRSARRFEYDLRRLVALVQKDRRALVVLLTANPPGPAVESVLPGSGARVERYNELQRSVAEQFEDCVVVDVDALVQEHGIERLTPDSIHLTAEGHQLVAEAMEGPVLEWLTDRGHRVVPPQSRPSMGA